MEVFWQFFALSAPLFGIIVAGYAIALWRRWRREWTALASKFVFAVALPALLFHLMSDLSVLPPMDPRLLIAFFGGCLIVFALGRLVAARYFRLDGVSQSIFALGLPPIETSAVVLLASLSVGMNVYLMAAQFETLQSTVASSMVLSTALAAVTVPVLLSVLQAVT